MKIGFIGLGNVGGKLAGSLLRNGFELHVRDLDQDTAKPLLDQGAIWWESTGSMTREVDVVITCLPSPEASAKVMEEADGILENMRPGMIWAEMSTTDEKEVKRLGQRVSEKGGEPMDCPVSGGCHRAATGNISIFVGSERSTFERAMPLFQVMGRQILHTGPLGSASVLKVMTNYLASVHLASLGEALMTAKKAGMDLNTTYEAIRISSGNSFVHETESQVILNEAGISISRWIWWSRMSRFSRKLQIANRFPWKFHRFCSKSSKMAKNATVIGNGHRILSEGWKNDVVKNCLLQGSRAKLKIMNLK